MIDKIKQELNVSMKKVVDNLKVQLIKIRTGRASAHILDGVVVDYYGAPTPISQVGQISTPEARLLQVQPYDKTMITAVEKAILAANLGVTPSNDGNLVRIPFPALTEERRKQEVKHIKKFGEEAKILLRNLRRDQNEVVKKIEKNKEISEDQSKKYQHDIQTITDDFVAKIDEIITNKEKEVLTV